MRKAVVKTTAFFMPAEKVRQKRTGPVRAFTRHGEPSDQRLKAIDPVERLTRRQRIRVQRLQGFYRR